MTSVHYNVINLCSDLSTFSPRTQKALQELLWLWQGHIHRQSCEIRLNISLINKMIGSGGFTCSNIKQFNTKNITLNSILDILVMRSSLRMLDPGFHPYFGDLVNNFWSKRSVTWQPQIEHRCKDFKYKPSVIVGKNKKTLKCVSSTRILLLIINDQYLHVLSNGHTVGIGNKFTNWNTFGTFNNQRPPCEMYAFDQ